MKWGHCGAKLASFSWTPSLSFWSVLLISSFFWPYCLGSQSPGGFWSFASDWFAPRFSVRAMPFTLPTYRRSFEQLVKMCQPSTPRFGTKHPLGMFWHYHVSKLIDSVVANRVFRLMSHSGQTMVSQLAAESALTKISEQAVVQHFTILAAAEADLCRFLATRAVNLQNLALGNLTLIYNSTTDIVQLMLPEARPRLTDFRQWMVSVQASIFSSVAASVTLFVVLWLRIPIIRCAFGFRFPVKMSPFS